MKAAPKRGFHLRVRSDVGSKKMKYVMICLLLLACVTGCAKREAEPKREWDRDAVMFKMLEGADLSVPYDVEYTIVWMEPVDEAKVKAFAESHGFSWQVDNIGEPGEPLYNITIVTNMMVTEESIRPVSKLVKSFAEENGWDYDAWGITYVK